MRTSGTRSGSLYNDRDRARLRDHAKKAPWAAVVRYALLTCVAAGAFSGCGRREDDSESSEQAPASRERVEQAERGIQEGIIPDFVNAISSGDYGAAFKLLDPKLAEAWTADRFAVEWRETREQIGNGWQPQLTETFVGRSPRGRYEQAKYRLSADWRSAASVELIAMGFEAQPRLVRVYLRLPHRDEIPDSVKAAATGFVDSMVRQDFKAASNMSPPESRAQYPEPMLRQLAPILGDSASAISFEYYRICANAVWYEGVLLRPTNDPATFIEIIVSTKTSPASIRGLSCKGRAAAPVR